MQTKSPRFNLWGFFSLFLLGNRKKARNLLHYSLPDVVHICPSLFPSLVNMPNLISVHCRLFRNQTEPIVATKFPPLFVHRHQIHSRDYYRPPPTILPGKTSSITLRRTRVHYAGRGEEQALLYLSSNEICFLLGTVMILVVKRTTQNESF